MGSESSGNPFELVKYDIKVIKVRDKLLLKFFPCFILFIKMSPLTQMFKGPTENIDTVYTPRFSATCGVSLDTNGEQYLITGRYLG